MTLEEWEARRHDGGGGASAGGGAAQQQQAMTDEELARQLQRQLDLEAAQVCLPGVLPAAALFRRGCPAALTPCSALRCAPLPAPPVAHPPLWPPSHVALPSPSRR